MKKRKKNVATLTMRTDVKKNPFAKSITQLFKKPEKVRFDNFNKLDFEEDMKGKTFYFFDVSALVHFSGPLYAYFLIEEPIRFEHIIPGENNVFVTDEASLIELKEMENDKSQKLIYSGYTDFIKRNFYVISVDEAENEVICENMLREFAGGTEDIIINEPFAHSIGSLRFLYDNNLDPILVSLDEKTKASARLRMYETYEIG